MLKTTSKKPKPKKPEKPETSETSDSESSKSPTPKKTKPQQKQIMISYNWGSQPLVVQLVQNLKRRGYKVWIDLEQMSGSTLEAMAQAIEESDVILMGVTEKYRLSANCRIEGEYSYSLKKPIIPLMMQDNYKPTGWLGALLGSKLWFKFSNENDLQTNLDQLVHEMDRSLGTSSIPQPLPVPTSTTLSLPTSAPVAVAPKKENLFHNWDQKRVHQWLEENELGCIEEKFEKMKITSGACLAELQSLREQYLQGQNLSKFYEFLATTLQLHDIGDVLRFSYALRS